MLEGLSGEQQAELCLEAPESANPFSSILRWQAGAPAHWGGSWKQTHEDKGVPDVSKPPAVPSACWHGGGRSVSAQRESALLVPTGSTARVAFLLMWPSHWTGTLSLVSWGLPHAVVVPGAVVSVLITPCSQIAAWSSRPALCFFWFLWSVSWR